MRQQFSSNPRTELRFFPWPTALIGIVVIKAVLSLAVKPGSFLVDYSGISYFLLLLLATSFAIRNGIQNTLRGRPFWAFLAIAYSLWALDQWLFLYYELGLHIEVPDNSIADSVLFLHIVPLMAAVASLPHRNVSDRKPYRAILNSLLLLFSWSFIYGYTVFPYQYLFSKATSSSYALRFDILYLLENLALLLAVGILTLRVQAPWKSIYLHLLGASTLYALSSAVANLAIDSGGYANGKLYGLGLTASVCWFVWIPLSARQVPEAEVRATRSDTSQASKASLWAMLVVVMISIPIVWELFHRNENSGLRTLRLAVAIAAIVFLTCAAYMKEYLAKRELASHLGFANDRLRLAVEAGKAVGWEWDLKRGRDSWFGDLQTVFGIPSDTFVGRTEDFYRYVHPEDRQLVAKAVVDARQSGKPYAAEFRILRPDGTVRWVTARGKFYYSRNGDPERMLGMAVDITERKQAESALADVNRRAIEAEERENNRIARDLHEDIGQRLALLAIEIERLKTEAPNQTIEIRGRMEAVWKRTLEIFTDVKASAHELHSPRLEYLGLAAVMSSFCEELGERKRVKIDFRNHGLPSLVRPDVSICLFRVLQEALYNGLKHSGVLQFEVQLWGTSDEIRLTVRDSGTGFDLEAASKGRGLGLIRMEQRLKLVNGTLSIESQLKRGTTIHARAPLSSGSNSIRAAG
jgi:PAS domain S-box-containing protein